MLTRKPMILVLAGPNGSGKSTITQYFEKIGIYTNADDVVAATGMSNADAAKLVDSKRYESIIQKYDNTIEPVRIIRKHKEEVSVFPNELWSEERIIQLIEE